MYGDGNNSSSGNSSSDDEMTTTMMMMMRKKKIVVAVDESEESMHALSWCLSNLLTTSNTNSVSDDSLQDNSTLVLLYVKPPPPVYSALDISGVIFGSDVVAAMEDYSRELIDSVMARAEAVCRKSNVTVKVEKKVGSGDAKHVLCECVERLGASVLVMGCHGYGFFKRAFLGSVSDYCAKHAKCPVVVVKRQEPFSNSSLKNSKQTFGLN